ncbi:MAG: hypothetical protein CMQ43_03685 [Gammaproteobacteria bacterium]|nr:hypothetical protein [Gammaproteobacteria bacterium]
MVRRFVIRLVTVCVLLASVTVVAEVELPDAHMTSAELIVAVSSLVESGASSDSNSVQHEDHCCHGHVMADPGQTQIAGPIDPICLTRQAPVSAESLVFSPPVRPPKRSSLPQFA